MYIMWLNKKFHNEIKKWCVNYKAEKKIKNKIKTYMIANLFSRRCESYMMFT